mmetsp:Transcript_32840/g.23748  ORF Transcript_32840/g.23748 Transcript_32840/m.23748 type:complete len:80 (+) Transcript_32840:269-508(+)
MLVVRTYLSIWLSDVNGRIVKAIVDKSLSQFLQRVVTLVLFAVPSSTINSSLDYFQKKLSLAFRRRLTHHFHDQYHKNL